MKRKIKRQDLKQEKDERKDEDLGFETRER